MTIDYALYKQVMEYLAQYPNTPTKHLKHKPHNTTKPSLNPTLNNTRTLLISSL